MLLRFRLEIALCVYVDGSKSRAREEELLQAAESGDVARLRTLVLGRDLNFESTDQLGRTPLHLAVVNDHKEVSGSRDESFAALRSVSFVM